MNQLVGYDIHYGVGWLPYTVIGVLSAAGVCTNWRIMISLPSRYSRMFAVFFSVFLWTGWMTLPVISWYLPCFRLESLIRQAENRCRAGVLYRIIASDLKYCLTIDRKIICRRLWKVFLKNSPAKLIWKQLNLLFATFQNYFATFSGIFTWIAACAFFGRKYFKITDLFPGKFILKLLCFKIASLWKSLCITRFSGQFLKR